MGFSKLKTPARKRVWGLSVERGGDFALDQRRTGYARTLDGTNYKSVMVADKTSQHQSHPAAFLRVEQSAKVGGEDFAVLRIELQGIVPLFGEDVRCADRQRR